MPRHPEFGEKINYVIELVTDACDAPFSVYVKTLYPAVMEALVMYYAIDVMQMFTGFVAPGGPLKPTRGGPHGGWSEDPDVKRRGRGKGRGAKRTWSKTWRVWSGFDPSDWLGSTAAKAFQGGSRNITPGVSTLWNVYGLEQRAVYIVFMAELIEQFFYKWASGVAESFYCQEQYRPWCLATSPNAAKLGVVYEDAMPFDEVVKGRGVTYAAGNLISLQGPGSQCTFSGKYDGPDQDSDSRLLIRHQSGIEVLGPVMNRKGSFYTVSGAALEEGGWYFLGVGSSGFNLLECEYSVFGNSVYGPGEDG